MDQERFDQIARAVSSGASRRKVLGGAVAGIFGASVASVAGLAKGKKGGKNRNKRSKGKKAKAEFTCTAANANVECGPGACCRSTPAGSGPSCVPLLTQIGSTICGDSGAGVTNAGEGVCRTCPPGTLCSNNSLGELRCVCDPTVCDGCCIFNDGIGEDDQCIANGSGEPVNSPNPGFDGAFVCGVSGGECSICSLGPQIFSGCCDANGACRSGTSGNDCGNSGDLCEVCPQGEECGIDQTCSGDPPPGPCAAGLTECPAGSGTCVNLGTNPDDCGACGNVCPGCSKGRSRLCNGGSCGCSAKKKKRKKRRRRKN